MSDLRELVETVRDFAEWSMTSAEDMRSRRAAYDDALARLTVLATEDRR